MEDSLTNDGERDRIATLGSVEDLVTAHGHRHHLRLEAGGDHAVERIVIDLRLECVDSRRT